MKSLKAKFRKSDTHEWNKNDERLLSAVEHGEVEKVSALLSKKGPSPTKLDGEGKSALHVAALRGQADCLAVILAHGADASLQDASGFTALHIAAKNDHLDCAKKLLQSKCVVDVLDGSARTALHHAAASGNVAIVELLCEHKCQVNPKDSDGYTPLLLAARHAHKDVCQSLLDRGANPNASDKNGRTAVMLASEGCCPVTAQLLVQRGAHLNTVDSLGHDVFYYAKLSGSSELRSVLNAALHRQPASDKTPAKSPQHGQMATKLNEDRSSTPKKRKAPPPPISPIQFSGSVSPPFSTPAATPLSGKSDSFNRFSYKDMEVKSAVLREEAEKLQREKSKLLETIEDLKQIMAQTEPKAEHSGTAVSTLIANLQAKITSLSLENQQLSQILKKRPAPQGEEGQAGSRPNSFESNASFHSTRADFELSSDMNIHTGDEESPSEMSAVDKSSFSVRFEMDEDLKLRMEKEVRILREALETLQAKLLESRLENRTLQERLSAEPQTMEISSGVVLENVPEIQKLGKESPGEDDSVLYQFQYLKGCLEKEVKELKEKLFKAEEERQRDVCLIKDLQRQIQSRSLSEDVDEIKSYTALLENINQEKALLIEKYKESQEEIRMLQEALLGTVPVEAAAKDFEEMKAELGQIIDGLQRRLLELSKSYSEAKSELSAARNQLQAKASDLQDKTDAVAKDEHEQKIQEVLMKMKDIQNTLKDTESKHQAALEELFRIKQDAENQAQASVSLTDHTQVVASLGNAIKDLETKVDHLKEQLAQKSLQVDALQNRLTVEKDVTPDDSFSRLEYEQMRETLETELSQLKQQLKDALRKQDEMALEVEAAWQEVKDNRRELELAQELAVCRERECCTVNTKYKEAQDGVVQLQKQMENHVISERDKNKKIEELSKEVIKLKDALNSLSQLSYTTSTPKRQQNQQQDSLQQQIKQLQYQLAEAQKQHNEIVSVYRMHLLYAVQGQMDEDVQKALKQILVMCKMPTDAE